MEQNTSWEAGSHSFSQETPTFYGTRKFITVSTRARHWFCPDPDAPNPQLHTLFPQDPF
jgi:hypothetical protein